MGCHSLLQGIFLTQGSNLGLLHCRFLYRLSHQGSPLVAEPQKLTIWSHRNRYIKRATEDRSYENMYYFVIYSVWLEKNKIGIEVGILDFISVPMNLFVELWKSDFNTLNLIFLTYKLRGFYLMYSYIYPLWVPHVCSVTSVVSDSLWAHGLQPARHLCPWDSPGKNTGVGCHPLLQEPSQPRDQSLVSCIAGKQFFAAEPPEKHVATYIPPINLVCFLLQRGTSSSWGSLSFWSTVSTGYGYFSVSLHDNKG